MSLFVSYLRCLDTNCSYSPNNNAQQVCLITGITIFYTEGYLAHMLGHLKSEKDYD